MSSIFQVDAFTDRPFAGNPAAVCLLDELADDLEITDAWLQRVAAEMNLAETAFVRRAEGGFDLRWMTPTVEVDLCGHATLAAAHILWERGYVSSAQSISFFPVAVRSSPTVEKI
jgi:PhzF family phenazine biosynthesis protein